MIREQQPRRRKGKDVFEFGNSSYIDLQLEVVADAFEYIVKNQSITYYKKSNKHKLLETTTSIYDFMTQLYSKGSYFSSFANLHFNFVKSYQHNISKLYHLADANNIEIAFHKLSKFAYDFFRHIDIDKLSEKESVLSYNKDILTIMESRGTLTNEELSLIKLDDAIRFFVEKKRLYARAYI